MDTTQYNTIKIIDSEGFSDTEINTIYLKAGWDILNLRTERIAKDNGSYTERLIYTLGHESPHAGYGL